MKDSAVESSTDYYIDQDEMEILDGYQYSTLLELGRAQSTKGVSLLTEVDLCNDSKQSKSILSDALFLFKQSYNHFNECLTQDPQNYAALRNWGSAICKEAFTLKLLGQTSPDPMKLVVDGGEKLILAYRISPENEQNRKALSKFFFDQGSYLLQQFTKDPDNNTSR